MHHISSIAQRLLASLVLLLILALAGAAQSITPVTQQIALPGSPFAVVVTPDGHYVFASLSGLASGIAIIEQDRASASLLGVLATGDPVFGLAVTADGKYLLDTIQGSAATLATFPAGQFPRQWALSQNGEYLYLTEFSSNLLAIFPVHELLEDVKTADKD